MRPRWVVAVLLAFSTGCWAEVFLPAETEGSSGMSGDTPMMDGSDADETAGPGCDGDPANIVCDGECVDPGHDLEHCGDCNVECAADEICELGDCVFNCECDPAFEICIDERCECREGTERCDGNCVVLRTDATHCGECGNECDEVCLDFACEPDCGPLTDCAGDCTTLDEDPFNCGECGHECDAHEVCVFGSCRDSEPIPFPCEECPCGDFCEGLDAGLICCEILLTDGPLCVDTPICGE